MHQIEWRDISGYEGIYQISNTGEVRNASGKILRQSKNKKGYFQLCLTKNKIERTERVHRLVAKTFIPNPDNLPTVNHKDENKENNCVDNLEWMTFTDNSKYGTRALRCGIPVYQTDLDGNIIAFFPTMKDAERITGVDRSHISLVCQHSKRRHTAGGYKWEFAPKPEYLSIREE